MICFIEELTISYEEKTYNMQNIIIEYQPEHFIETIYLDNLIVWNSNRKITINILYQSIKVLYSLQKQNINISVFMV